MLALFTLGKRWIQLSNVGSIPEPSECELELRIKIFFQSGLVAKHPFCDNCVHLFKFAFSFSLHQTC